MNDHEFQSFEAELRALKPAPTPPGLLAKLEVFRPALEPAQSQPGVRVRWRVPGIWGWFAPVSAVAVLALVFAFWQWHHVQPSGSRRVAETPLAAPSPDEVEIDRQLVVSYDAIAELPSGVPVRVHCQEWQDKVVFRDPLRGLAIERRTPRLEVIPVSFETY